MNKPLLILCAAGAAALLLLPKSDTTNGDDSGKGVTTAGDDESNILIGTVDAMTSAFSNWPSGSGPYQDTLEQAANSNGVPVQILAWLLWNLDSTGRCNKLTESFSRRLVV